MPLVHRCVIYPDHLYRETVSKWPEARATRLSEGPRPAVGLQLNAQTNGAVAGPPRSIVSRASPPSVVPNGAPAETNRPPTGAEERPWEPTRLAIPAPSDQCWADHCRGSFQNTCSRDGNPLLTTAGLVLTLATLSRTRELQFQCIHDAFILITGRL